MPCLQKALCMKQRQQLLLYSSTVELKQQEKLCQVTIINNGPVYYNYVPLFRDANVAVQEHGISPKSIGP